MDNNINVTYGLSFFEAYRGDERQGSLYGGFNKPSRGWVWELAQYHPIVETDDEMVREGTPLITSPSVFPDISEAKENAKQVLRVLEPDSGRDSPINQALLSYRTWGA